jgi:hypothetical protein
LHEDSNTDTAAPRTLPGIDMLNVCITRQKFVRRLKDDATARRDSLLREVREASWI